ncbi:MAG: hypothetical protein HUK04_03470 [Bacteroidaceae bacterium]|nr:hypothetical protein [Bacteroidaceae bacterium]
MKILINARDVATASRVKDLLDSFGRGLHIFTRDDGISYYGCVLCIGDFALFQQPEMLAKFPEPHSDDDWQRLEHDLWTFYRDKLKDEYADRCSCGMFEFCHCH